MKYLVNLIQSGCHIKQAFFYKTLSIFNQDVTLSRLIFSKFHSFLYKTLYYCTNDKANNNIHHQRERKILVLKNVHH
jgi:hypothetical protein